MVCAIGANDRRSRELDNAVLQRASFVCCDSIEQAKLESGDLIEPIEQGVLDWLEVHELQEIVAGEVQGRQSAYDIVLFKSTAWRPGMWPQERSPSSGPANRESDASSRASSLAWLLRVVAECADDLGAVERRSRSRGVVRFLMYGSSRISASRRPRSCSLITYWSDAVLA